MDTGNAVTAITYWWANTFLLTAKIGPFRDERAAHDFCMTLEMNMVAGRLVVRNPMTYKNRFTVDEKNVVVARLRGQFMLSAVVRPEHFEPFPLPVAKFQSFDDLTDFTYVGHDVGAEETRWRWGDAAA